MERRSFLLGLFGFAGSAALASTLIPTAEATPLDQLRNLAPPDDMLDPEDIEVSGETPDGTPVEEAQARYRQARRVGRRTGRRTGRYVRRSGRRYARGYRRGYRRGWYGAGRGRYWHGGRWWGGRRWVCRTRFDRWGRPFRSCFWNYW